MSDKVHALIVDDEPLVRYAIRRMLTAGQVAEFQFEEAANGNEALRKFDPRRTDLVFLDWSLPGLSGLAVLYRLRALATCRRVWVIMVSGEARIGKIEDALDRAGADGYVLKPFTIEELHRPLLKLIGEVLEAKQHAPPAQPGLLGRLF